MPGNIFKDIEGKLIISDHKKQQIIIKELSLQVAWHLDDIYDILDISEELSEYFKKVDITKDKIILHYSKKAALIDTCNITDLIFFDSPLGFWQILLICKDLIASLNDFHQQNLFQMIIHPKRIAAIDSKFSFLPTIGGVLNPLPQLFKKTDSDHWLSFIAPEILRTRGSYEDMAASADIYSLGKIFYWFLNKCSYKKIEDKFEYSETLIENIETDLNELSQENYHSFYSLIINMCNRNTELRPKTNNIENTINKLLNTNNPYALLKTLLENKNFKKAKQICINFEKIINIKYFNKYKSDYHICYSDYLYNFYVNNEMKAINELIKAQKYDIYNYIIDLKIGIIYSNYTAHNQHELLAADSFFSAMEKSGYKPDIIDLFVKALIKFENEYPDHILNVTEEIPEVFRVLEIFIFRAQSFLKKEDKYRAWYELINAFRKFGYSKNLHDNFLIVAKTWDKHKLLKWKSNNLTEPGIELAVSSIFTIYKSHLTAEKWLLKAKTYQKKDNI